MTFSDLDQLVTDTRRGDTSIEYGKDKLGEEAGEVDGEFAEARRARRPVDPVKVMSELGDVLWCVAHIAQCLGYTAGDAARLVDAKLRARLLHGKQPNEEHADAVLLLRGARETRDRPLFGRIGEPHEFPSAGMGKDGYTVYQPGPPVDEFQPCYVCHQLTRHRHVLSGLRGPEPLCRAPACRKGVP